SSSTEEPPPPMDAPRPRRGAGKRGNLNRPRRSSGVAPLPSEGDPAWAAAPAPATEGAVAIGPTTSALEPIEPERPRVDSPAMIIRLPAFAAEEKPRSRAPLYILAALALTVVAGGAWNM